MIDIDYYDVVTFYKVGNGGYGNKMLLSSDDVACLFLQNTGLIHATNADNITADAVCYPDPKSSFLGDNNYRLEGMYVLAPFHDVNDDDAWYKVESVNINKDILINNLVGNIELTLKKTSKLNLIS